MSVEIAKSEKSQPTYSQRSTVTREVVISIVKSSLSAVPWIGQALNEALFDFRARIQQERLNKFFTEVAEDVGRLNEEKIDKEYISTDEFSDYIESISKRVAENRSENKRARYRTILLSAISGNRPPDLSSVFLVILNEITDSELSLFSKLYVINSSLPPPAKPIDENINDVRACQFTKERTSEMGFEHSDFLAMVQSMVRKGILYDDGAGRFDTLPYEIIRMSELGVRFYKYLIGG